MANSTQYISLSILRTKKERPDSELSAHKNSFHRRAANQFYLRWWKRRADNQKQFCLLPESHPAGAWNQFWLSQPAPYPRHKADWGRCQREGCSTAARAQKHCNHNEYLRSPHRRNGTDRSGFIWKRCKWLATQMKFTVANGWQISKNINPTPQKRW